MNPAIQTILERRSIRKFLNKAVEPEKIRLALAAAMSAPSACNQQPWHFVVVSDLDTLKKLSEIHDGMRFVREASVAVVVLGEPARTVLECFWADDCAAATQNLLLAAHALGLGATWSGVNPEDAATVAILREALALPESMVPFAVVPVGYPAEEKAPGDRLMEDRIHMDRW